MQAYWSTGNSVHRVDFSPDSSKLACMRISDVYVCDLTQPRYGRVIVPIQNNSLSSQYWSLDSRSLAVVQKDSSVVVVAKFPSLPKNNTLGSTLGDDEERWVDVKAGNLALCCGWNPSNWLAVATDTGKVMFSHETEGTRWVTLAYGSTVVAVAAMETLWAFAVQKDGIYLCHSPDGSLFRRIMAPGLGVTRWLEFCPQNEHLLLVSDSVKTFVFNTTTRKYVSLASLSADFEINTLMTARWATRDLLPQLITVSKREGTLGNLITTVVNIDVSGEDGGVRGRMGAEFEIPPIANNTSIFFSLNTHANMIVWGQDHSGSQGVQVIVTEFESTAGASKTIMRSGTVTSCSVSNNGQFMASTMNEVVHVFRLLSFKEQVVDCVIAPFSLWEFVVDFFFGGSILCLLILSLVVFSSPWNVVDTTLELFFTNHFKW